MSDRHRCAVCQRPVRTEIVVKGDPSSDPGFGIASVAIPFQINVGSHRKRPLFPNIQTAPLKPLLQALLADLIAAQRPVPAPPSRTDEVEA